jgi:hypothetical protein
MLLRLNSVFKMVMEHMWTIHQCSVLILIYTLLIPEEETRKARKPSREQCSFCHRGTLNRKVLSLFSVLNGQTHLLVTEGAPRRFINGHTDM